jgi:hypothetical protein
LEEISGYGSRASGRFVVIARSATGAYYLPNGQTDENDTGMRSAAA